VQMVPISADTEHNLKFVKPLIQFLAKKLLIFEPST
jgi:hypothetical protein